MVTSPFVSTNFKTDLFCAPSGGARSNTVLALRLRRLGGLHTCSVFVRAVDFPTPRNSSRTPSSHDHGKGLRTRHRRLNVLSATTRLCFGGHYDVPLMSCEFATRPLSCTFDVMASVLHCSIFVKLSSSGPCFETIPFSTTSDFKVSIMRGTCELVKATAYEETGT